MKNNKFLFLTAAAMLFAACSSDDNNTGNNGPAELRLTSGIDILTRATHGLDTQFGDGETVHVWVDDAGTATTLYTNVTLTKGNGGTLTGATTMYFPSTGNSVDIYALHGNMTLAGDDYPTAALTHTVASDQQSSITDAGKGYQGSDLVYARQTGVSHSGNPTTVSLMFHHLLSKVEVVLVEGDGNEGFLSYISSLQVLGTLPTAGFTLSKDGADYGKNTEQTDGIEVTASGTATPISLDYGVTLVANKDDESKQVLNEAIIVPQTVTSGTPFISVAVGDRTFVYNLANTTNFESGKKYKYVITVNETGLSVTSQISDWTEGGDFSGDAEEQ